MASILRQIVAGPRARHPEARLDLCYVTDKIIVTSGPSSVWPKKAYRNPTEQLVGFLDKKHGKNWAIFEFRAEGTGYPDSEVYNRVHHFPWPDHHPPPFAIIPNLVASMRNWLQGGIEDSKDGQRVVVVHCKAGKGRSGTVACSYLISQEGWSREEALQRFTMRRMRAGFGNGVSIPSQLRWVRYVDRWTNELDKKYIERPVEILEVHVWGLRDGVKVAVEGFIEEGRVIKQFHTFTRDEKQNMDELETKTPTASSSNKNQEILTTPIEGGVAWSEPDKSAISNVVLKPKTPIKLPTSDMNIDFERRNKANYTGFTMVTSIAHVWFNAFFEGGCKGDSSGVFEIDWEAMDGIKGSARKGIKCLDRLKVVWKYSDEEKEQVIHEPKAGEPIHESRPADWRGSVDHEKDDSTRSSEGLGSGKVGGAGLVLGEMTVEATGKLLGKDLGLRKTDPGSADLSRASSIKDDGKEPHEDSSKVEQLHSYSDDDADEEEHEGVKPHGPEGEEVVEMNHDDKNDDQKHNTVDDGGRQDTKAGKNLEAGMAKLSNLLGKWKPSE